MSNTRYNNYTRQLCMCLIRTTTIIYIMTFIYIQFGNKFVIIIYHDVCFHKQLWSTVTGEESDREALYFALLLGVSALTAVLVCILLIVVAVFSVFCHCRHREHQYSEGETL